MIDNQTPTKKNVVVMLQTFTEKTFDIPTRLTVRREVVEDLIGMLNYLTDYFMKIDYVFPEGMSEAEKDSYGEDKDISSLPFLGGKILLTSTSTDEKVETLDLEKIIYGLTRIGQAYPSALRDLADENYDLRASYLFADACFTKNFEELYQW